MENFFMYLLNIGELFVGGITSLTYGIFYEITRDIFNLAEININLVLFSDTPIYTGDLGELFFIFLSIFYTMIFITLIWKIIKKFFVKITRWNKW